MAFYITREDIVSVGATQLTDLYDDADPGVIQAPTNHISQIIYSGVARLDAEASDLVGGLRIRGDAVQGQPVLSVGAYGMGGSGTGTSATVTTPPTILYVDIPVEVSKNLSIYGLVAGTAGDDIAMSATLRFDAGGGKRPLYFSREDVLAIGAQQLTDEWDDGSPPDFRVPPGYTRVAEIIAAAVVVDAAADDIATSALQLRGDAVLGTPTISLFAGGLGAVNTGVAQEVGVAAVQIPVDIPLVPNQELELWGLLAGETGATGNMAATAVIV